MDSLDLIDLPPAESVQRAQEASAQGYTRAWEALDRHFRWHLLDHLQNRSGSETELGDALLEACRWAEREEREPWYIRWVYLLELLRDADRQPALAADLRAVGPEGRAAEMLKILAEHPRALRPSDLVELMGLSIQQISNLGRKLESAELIDRHSVGGKATWFIPTGRGFKLAELLPVAEPVRVKEQENEAPDLGLWQLADDFAKVA
jgi:hypothetical protein